MSKRHHWLAQVTTRLFAARTHTRRGRYQRFQAEALEGRQYLSASMSLLDGGQTLTVTGDSTDNTIEIVQDDRGVHVTADGAPTQSFTGVTLILVETGDGNDDVRVIHDLNPPSGRPSDELHSLDLRVSLGAGDDSFTGEIRLGSGSVRVGVDAGAGNDVVNFRTLIDPNDRTLIDPNERTVIGPNDRSVLLYANLGAGNDVLNADLEFPPDPCRLVALGGDGADSLNVNVGAASGGTGAGEVQGTIDVLLNGEGGNDSVYATVRNATLNGRSEFDLEGGDGNDVVYQTFDNVLANAPLGLNAHGGAGDDYVIVSARTSAQTTSDTVPALIANSSVEFNVQGDAGNDHVIGLIQPCILPAGTLDMLFSGGSGDDVLIVVLGLEAGTLNPPSGSDPGRTGSGPIELTALGDDGDDKLYLTVQNLKNSVSPFQEKLDGGAGSDTAVVTSGIDASGWTT
ncbi:MAG: hypothetical protein HQ518_12425 [Rhodopirellula sp.]|nr:hypothetical protein [Rhodopirellula sp.]